MPSHESSILNLAKARSSLSHASYRLCRLSKSRPNAEEKRQGDAMTGSAKVYELRIYHAAPGKMESLQREAYAAT